MAVYKLFPLKDASLYAFYPFMNTGIDAIIEVGNLNVNTNPVPQVFRYIIQFDQSEIEEVIDNKIPVDSNGNKTHFSSSLKAYIANAQGINFNTFLEIYPISGSWNNGNGSYLDSPFSVNGVSWKARNFSGSSAQGAEYWNINVPSYADYVTSSFSQSLEGGGTWYTGSSDPNNTNVATSVEYQLRSDKDLNVDVSDIVNIWYSSSNNIGGYTNIENNGFFWML